MLRRIRRRRAKVQSVAIAGAAIAAIALLSGCEVGDRDDVSATCTSPDFLYNAFVADRAVRLQVGVQPDPSNSRTTWVCYYVSAFEKRTRSAGDVQPVVRAGRISVTTPPLTSVQVPTVDGESRACESEAGNLVPGNPTTGMHPIVEGAVFDTPLYLDAYASTGKAWLCVEADSVKRRVVVPLPGATATDFTVLNDPSPPPLEPSSVPADVDGRASSSCYLGRYGTAYEDLNSRIQNTQLYVYDAQPNANSAHICARIEGNVSGGVHLGVNANTGVRVEQLLDDPANSYCRQSVLRLDPTVSLRVTQAGQSPQAVCLNGTRYQVVTGSGTADPVDLDIDPDTPLSP